MTVQPTIEWQVAGACNYDCTYCIQSPRYRRGRPHIAQIDAALRWFGALPNTWEIKCSGGEAFAHPLFLDRIVPGLMGTTPHTISVLTNFSSSPAELQRFVALTRGRLRVFSASLHREFVTAEDFVAKARWLADQLDPDVDFVVNQVVLPGQEDEARRCRELVTAAGLRWFPQLYKTNGGVAAYPDPARVQALIHDQPANTAPSYRGARCLSGVLYLVVDKDGYAWRCRTARRYKEGALGNIFDGSAQRWAQAQTCPYDICPCTVPANRGMIQR